MVKDPVLRRINRNLDRQKKTRMRRNLKLISNPEDPISIASVEAQSRKIAELKRQKSELLQRKTLAPAEATKKG